MIRELLKGVFYPKFLPKCPVKELKIPGWKIIILNAGPVTGKPVVMKRLSDEHCESFTQAEIEKKFLFEADYIRYVGLNGFQLFQKKEGCLFFKKLSK